MTATSPVLLSWIAIINDPYEPTPPGEDEATSARITGPTLTLLFDEESPFHGKIEDIVLFQRDGVGSEREKRAIERTVAEIRRRNGAIRVHSEVWRADDPTDHKGIFEFLRSKIPQIRRRFVDRELVVHATPGTPAMHTLWVLMAETGFIGRPFRVVQSLRKADRRGRPAAIPVDLGIDTFYKAYLASRPSKAASDEEAIVWDPARFQSTRLKALFVEARRFAQLKVPVLILGERGTGKTTLATWIRLHSPYRREALDRKWPVVACGQYTPETMRSELFGHVKGAFTDAKESRDGLLVSADKDTLFLDEIGDVSKDLQRLLIKALEEKSFSPVGSTDRKKSDFRLLTATNLPMTVLRERLDPDFLDRIGLLELRLPPLRDVPEELSWLWDEVFAISARRAEAAERHARLGQKHHARLVRAFEQHPLPGNLRDLFRVAYRLVAARNDPAEPLSPDAAVDYALQGLSHATEGAPTDLPRAVARAFADGAPLDEVLRPGLRLDVDALDRGLAEYIARETKRLSRDRRVPEDTLCTRSTRALRAWRNGPKGKKSAGESVEDSRISTVEHDAEGTSAT